MKSMLCLAGVTLALGALTLTTNHAAAATPTTVVFCGGDLASPAGLNSTQISAYRSSGFQRMVLFTLSIQANGDFMYSGNTLCSGGNFVGPSGWVSGLNQCLASPSSINRIEMCVSGWADASFTNIKNIMAAQGNNTGNILWKNLIALRNATPIAAISFDDEGTYDSSSAVAFGGMAGSMGFKVTLCPYTNPGFWQAVKNGLGSYCDDVYLQCYDGGAGNNPATWNSYFGNGFQVIAGYWDNERTSIFLTKMQSWASSSKGGFLWPTYDCVNCTGVNEFQLYSNWIHQAMDVVQPNNYVAGENGTVNFGAPADLAYGANGSYFYLYSQTGNVTFNPATFGGDPDFGVVKSGYAHFYTQCTGEGGSATFTVPVEAAYGAQGKYFYKRGVSGTVTFNPSSFGGDPDFGVSKGGYYMPYTLCAVEGGSATFSSPTDVAYGANGKYYFLYGVTGTITFSNTSFGGDPNFGVAKVGYYRSSGPTPIAGVYSIKSTGDNGTALQATGDTYYNGSSYNNGLYEVAVTPYTNGWSYQQWTVTPIGNGQYHIINKADGLSLQATGDPYNNGHGIVGGANKVALTPGSWNLSQQVWLFNAGAGYALANPATSQNLQASQDSYKGSSTNYQVLDAPYAWGVGSAQEWNLVWVSAN